MAAVLSVVVPIYNVAPHLNECLSSIAGQYHRDLEVVMVDDGSTDDSAAIAARFAARDGRFHLVRQENRGLGAARNRGVADAGGDFLMFVDSDDVLPPYAAELLLAALERSGSDFASGNVMRLTSRGVRPSGMHRRPFATTRLRTHVTVDATLLHDRTAWNKVFRRRFWDAHALRFPEGVLYEDTPVMVPAHVLAKSVDALEVPVYYWREREGADRSITQRREEVRGFTDRLAGVASVSGFLAAQGEARIKQWYDASALRDDLMLFMRVLPAVDDEYRRTFLDRCNDFLDTVAPGVVAGLPAAARVLWTLVRHRMLAELLEVVPLASTRVPIVRRGVRRYHDLPYLDAGLPQLPRALFLAGTPRPRTRLHEASWQGDRLRLRGHAFIPGQRAVQPWSTTRLLWLEEVDGRDRRRVPTVARRCADATADAGRPDLRYDWSGFEAVLDPRMLRGRDGRWHDGQWRVAVGVIGVGQRSRGPFEAGQRAEPLRLTSRYVAEDVRVTPVLTGGALTVRVERLAARATAARLMGDRLEIEGALVAPAAADPPLVTVSLLRAPGVPWREYPGEVAGGRFVVAVPVDDLTGRGAAAAPLRPGEPGDRWRVEVSVDGATAPLAVHPDSRWAALVAGRWVVHPQPDPAGHLVVAALPAGPVMDEVTGGPAGFRLAGSIPAGPGDRSAPEVVLRLWAAREAKTFRAEVRGDRWRVDVDPLAVPIAGGAVRLRAGTWDLLCRTGGDQLTQLPLAGPALDGLPLPLPGDPGRVSLERLSGQRAVLRVRPELAGEERGPAAAAHLRTRVYPRLRRRPLRDVVLYNSFTGRQFSDNPRAVYRELLSRGLPLEHEWVVADGQAPVPPGVGRVALGSRRWYEALATSRYVVTNQHLPEWFRRRDGQVVVQTWHGTPLKRIGFDIADPRFADRAYLDKLASEAPNWSQLVSPNRFSTGILRRAFRYDGEIVEVGYPRNDVLFADRGPIIERVRAELGLPAGRRIVLYAPTWRDDEFYGPGRYKISMRLDVDRAAAELAADHVLLVRRHPNVVDDIPQAGDGFVWDVSTYPDMGDLMAAADVLVTDYSSVMFDFANTGRPMLFFAYDLAHYRDTLRGFYVDFEAEAPGPLLATSEEVVAAIRDVDAVAARYAERYRAFAARACDLDDGHASARLVDRMLDAGRRITSRRWAGR